MGEPRVSAEETAMKAVGELLTSLDAGACVDQWCAAKSPRLWLGYRGYPIPRIPYTPYLKLYSVPYILHLSQLLP